MKIRINNNEIRLRVSEEENKQLQAGEELKIQVQFNKNNLNFTLCIDNTSHEEYCITYSNNTFVCKLHPFLANELTEGSLHLQDGNLHCFIEIDLKGNADNI